MSYPATSNWMDPATGSAWFIHRITGRPTTVCATTGWDSLADLQLELQSRLANGSFTTYDGSAVVDTSIFPNDPSLPPFLGWSLNLLKALYAIARDAHAPQSYLSAIQSDAQVGSGPISAGTLQTGLWIGKGYYSGVIAGSGATGYGVGSPDEVSIPTSAVMPSMDIAPPVPTNGVSSGAVCNVAPIAVDTLVPVNQPVVPFTPNVWLVLGVIVVAIGGALVLSRDVPITEGERATRRNPVRRLGARGAMRRALRNPYWY